MGSRASAGPAGRLPYRDAGATDAGFIGITSPTSPRYALETYVPRDQIPIQFDAHVYELRLLTVDRAHRRFRLAALLMYAADRWVEAHGGTPLSR